MKRKLVLSRQAERELEDIATFIAVDNPRAAKAVLLRIRTAFTLLKARPYIGRAAPETGQSDMRRLPSPPYVIFYRVREGSAQVSRILHGSRHLDEPSLYTH